jgi:aspartate-semialdehyde dehydrogenase
MKPVNVAVVGATGAVGEAMIEILESREFPVDTLYPLASSRSVGKSVQFRGKHHSVQDLSAFDFSKTPIGLFSAGGDISAEFAPIAAAAGCVVIDNTSHFRRDNDIPLVIPEVNRRAIEGYTQRGIIANPNCSTIGMLAALKPLYDAVGIERINVATYQAVSGTGKAAIEELAGQTARLLNGKAFRSPRSTPSKLLLTSCRISISFQDNGYTREEMKMVWETQKILDDPDILVNPTCVRVPVFFGHAEAVHIETSEPITAERATALLEAAEGSRGP